LNGLAATLIIKGHDHHKQHAHHVKDPESSPEREVVAQGKKKT
jgi:hypothetical protein